MHEVGELDGDHAFEVKAGNRHALLFVDGKSIYDRLHAPKFHLLYVLGSRNHWQEVGCSFALTRVIAEIVSLTPKAS